MRKGIITLGMVAFMVLFLSGCGKQQTSKNNNVQQKQTNTNQQKQINNNLSKKNNNAGNQQANNSTNSNKSGDTANQQPSDIIKAEYDCGGQKIEVTFDNSVSPQTAAFTYKGKDYKLPTGITGSGARYTDGSTVFWTHQGDANLSFNNDENNAIQCTGSNN